MVFPTQIGLPQLVLFMVALIGVGLLISSIMSLWIRREVVILEDDQGYKYRRYRRHRRFRWHHATTGIVLLLVSVLLLGITGVVQEYLGLTGKILVAHVHATQISNGGPIPTMSLELVLYDQNGNPTSDKAYLLNGDQWEVSGDLLEFPGWMNILGIHSGYKLTRLEGTYSDPNLEANQKHTVITLNGGDDSFFKTVYKQAWSSPFVTAGYGTAVFEPADGMSYNVCVSQDGLSAQPDTKAC